MSDVWSISIHHVSSFNPNVSQFLTLNPCSHPMFDAFYPMKPSFSQPVFFAAMPEPSPPAAWGSAAAPSHALWRRRQTSFSGGIGWSDQNFLSPDSQRKISSKNHGSTVVDLTVGPTSSVILTLPGKMPFWKERLPGLRKQFTSMTPEVFSRLAKTGGLAANKWDFKIENLRSRRSGVPSLRMLCFWRLNWWFMGHLSKLNGEKGKDKRMYIYMYIFIFIYNNIYIWLYMYIYIHVYNDIVCTQGYPYQKTLDTFVRLQKKYGFDHQTFVENKCHHDIRLKHWSVSWYLGHAIAVATVFRSHFEAHGGQCSLWIIIDPTVRAIIT